MDGQRHSSPKRVTPSLSDRQRHLLYDHFSSCGCMDGGQGRDIDVVEELTDLFRG